MRVLRKPTPVRGHLAQLAAIRWEYDMARDPEHYFGGHVRKVVRERQNVLVLYGAEGEVLTRYELRQTEVRAFWSRERQAYLLLDEL